MLSAEAEGGISLEARESEEGEKKEEINGSIDRKTSRFGTETTPAV